MFIPRRSVLHRIQVVLVLLNNVKEHSLQLLKTKHSRDIFQQHQIVRLSKEKLGLHLFRFLMHEQVPGRQTGPVDDSSHEVIGFIHIVVLLVLVAHVESHVEVDV